MIVCMTVGMVINLAVDMIGVKGLVNVRGLIGMGGLINVRNLVISLAVNMTMCIAVDIAVDIAVCMIDIKSLNVMHIAFG